eukprot:1061456-Lingulodinium_polyedra.AAC.1
MEGEDKVRKAASDIESTEGGQQLWVCDHVDEETGRSCQKVFKRKAAMLAHARQARRLRDAVAQLTVSNQCMYCMSTFVSRAVAVGHVKRIVSGQHTTCRVDRSIWSHPVISPWSLSCPLCGITYEELAHLQAHIRQHLPEAAAP